MKEEKNISSETSSDRLVNNLIILLIGLIANIVLLGINIGLFYAFPAKSIETEDKTLVNAKITNIENRVKNIKQKVTNLSNRSFTDQQLSKEFASQFNITVQYLISKLREIEGDMNKVAETNTPKDGESSKNEKKQE